MSIQWFASLETGDWVNAMTGAGTLVLAAVAVFQGTVASRQIKLGKRQAKTAEEQAETAKDQANIARDQAKSAEASAHAAIEVQRETLRARADQYAPRVTVEYATPTGPYFDTQRSKMPYANELRLLDGVSVARSELARGRHFIFTRDEDLFIWFRGRALIKNEGGLSAHVRLPSESRFVDNGRSESEDLESGPPMGGEPGVQCEAIVPPGGRAGFEWAAGKPLKEWVNAYENRSGNVPESSIWLWITVFDPREVGIIDTLLAHFVPEPLQPVDGLEGQWEVREHERSPHIHSFPIRRNYRHEGGSTEDLSGSSRTRV